jgi:hypothetical protein
MQHLMTTEALLVSLRSDVRAGRKDTTIAVWAGDLLGTTRMLIDSPAGRDPQLKQLLFEHACEATYGAPEYGGNRDLAGWRAIAYEGDVQPRGWSHAEVSGA